MTTKTIPQYLADERQKNKDDQARIEAEAARIQPLRHGHHRTAEQPARELSSPVKAIRKKKETTAVRKKPRITPKTVTKARKVA
jgi:hypothetical protein